VKKSNDDRKVFLLPLVYSLLRANLKRSNFSDQEIDVFFDMFKEDPSMDGLIVGRLFSPLLKRQLLENVDFIYLAIGAYDFHIFRKALLVKFLVNAYMHASSRLPLGYRKNFVISDHSTPAAMNTVLYTFWYYRARYECFSSHIGLISRY
jgi:hypothetical protein